MCEVPGAEGFVLLAVFDGHGGDGAAIYAEAMLINNLHATSKLFVEFILRFPFLLPILIISLTISPLYTVR